MGRHLAEQLSRLGHDIIIVDKDENKIVAVMESADVEGLTRDVTDPRFFEELDLSSFDAVVVVTDRDEVNLFVASIARLYNVKRIFVRAKNPHMTSLLRLIGVESVVIEPLVAANIIFSLLQGKYEPVQLLPSLAGGFYLVSGVVTESSKLRGKIITHAIQDGLVPPNIMILAVFDGERFYSPEEAPAVEAGHMVIALVDERGLKEFNELL